MTCVVALIMEVVLGEGGVKPLPDNTMQCLANLHDELNIPYIIDEIQTGCGRTGSVFGYAQTPLSSIEPEYVLLSKALGGGIVKIGVAMIKETIYDLDFGFLHTSTFAEDDISCVVALETLRIITENNGFLLKEAKNKGEYLRSELQKLKIKYPQIVKDIRGKGLMTGLEFHDLSQYGPIFRYAGRQGFISLLVTSYLLNYHQIRVLAPLTTLFKGNPGKKRESVLRIQPSVYITLEEIDKLAQALDETFGIVKANNEFCLMGHMIGVELTNQERQSPKKIPVLYPELKHQTDFDARIGFIVHITELKHLVDYYLPAFKSYASKNTNLIKWWNKLCRFLEPDVMHHTYIESDGFIIETNLVCVPYFPKYIIKTFSNAKIENNPDVFAKKYLTEIQDKIMDAAILARDLGDERITTSLVGLGAYTSIVTENGKTINDFEIPITTGNAYTTALMGQGIIKAAEFLNIDISESNAAVIGAAGNIGATISALLSFYCKKIILVGSDRSDSKTRLTNTINICLKAILTEIKTQIASVDNPQEIGLQGIAHDIYSNHVFPFLKKGNSKETAIIRELINDIITPGSEITDESASILEQLIIGNSTKTNPYFEIGNLENLKECHVVAIATNSPDNMIKPELIKEGAIVCCASVPSNLSDTFKNHLDKYFVFDGGFAKLPEGNVIDFVGMPKQGMAYGCLSETLIMAFNGQNSSFAKGQINIKQVMKTIELSDLYGFEVGDFRLGDTIINKLKPLNI